jgi:hypothetical protein
MTKLTDNELAILTKTYEALMGNKASIQQKEVLSSLQELQEFRAKQSQIEEELLNESA